MFRFEAEQVAREKKSHARPANHLDDFDDWLRAQKAKAAHSSDVPALTDAAAHVAHAPVASAAAAAEPRRLEAAAPSSAAAGGAPSWDVRDSSALDLDMAQTVALLKDVLHLGNDSEYPQATAALARARDEARNHTRSLLRYAVALHQVRLLFRGEHAEAITADLPAVLAQAKTYQYGRYVASLLAAVDASVQLVEATRHGGAAQRAEALRRLEAQAQDAQNPCYLASFLFAHHVWASTGEVALFAELYRRSKETPGRIPASATSWCVYRVAVHNLLLSKKPTETKKKQIRRKALDMLRLAQKLDEDDNGARRAAEIHFKQVREH